MSTPALPAQTPALQPGDSVRVWRRDSAAAFLDRVVAVTGDSLILRTLPLAFTDISQIDVARGTEYNRGKLAAFVVTGLVAGALGGYALGPRDRAFFCDTCLGDRLTTTAIGANLGAGVAWLLARKYATRRTWLRVWPPPAIADVAVQPIADTANKDIQPGHFIGLSSGSPIRVWVRDSSMVTGEFGTLSADRLSLQWRDKSWSVPLRSIDGLEVGTRHVLIGAAVGAVGFAATATAVELIALLTCITGDCRHLPGENFVLGSTILGGIVGGAIGNNVVTWTVRFTRE